MAENREEALTRSSRPAPQRRAASPSRNQRRRQRSVFQYIAVLFCAAFVLLLFTFIMERRQYQQLQEENEDNLQQSVSAVQTLNGLIEENEQLKQRVLELEDSNQLLKSQVQEQEQLLARKENDLSRTMAAMDWFWQINEAYVRGRTGTCRELIASLEKDGLQDYLSTQSVTDNDRFSPYDRYMEIREKVIK